MNIKSANSADRRFFSAFATNPGLHKYLCYTGREKAEKVISGQRVDCINAEFIAQNFTQTATDIWNNVAGKKIARGVERGREGGRKVKHA